MSAIVIVPYRPSFAEAFAALNRAWIEQLFEMEESDLKMLREPDRLIATGGQIFVALDDETPVGTVAAVRESDVLFELAKMAVSPSHQGRGIGERLGRAAIDFARAQGATSMFLETNSRLDGAIRLYGRLGFCRVARPHSSLRAVRRLHGGEPDAGVESRRR